MRRLAVAVLVLTLALASGYLLIASQQGETLGAVAALVVLLLVVPGAAVTAATFIRRPLPRGLVLGWACACLLGMAFISAMSIGIVVLPIALLACVAAVLQLRGATRGWLGACLGGVLGIAVVVAFLQSQAYLPPSCPVLTGSAEHGVITGTNSYPAGLSGGTTEVVSWTCQDGRLTSWSRSP